MSGRSEIVIASPVSTYLIEYMNYLEIDVTRDPNHAHRTLWNAFPFSCCNLNLCAFALRAVAESARAFDVRPVAAKVQNDPDAVAGTGGFSGAPASQILIRIN